MYATVRRLKTQPGAAREVASLIESEYVPLVSAVDGFVSYALVDLGDDIITSLGVFTGPDSATEGNALAKSWVAERLGPLIASPLEAAEGEVTVYAASG